MQYFDLGQDYFEKRYDSSIKWIEEKDHAVISNGPFYLEAYSPESRTITINTFDDETYPIEKGHWSKFEDVDFPRIVQVDIPAIMNSQHTINIETQKATEIKYFISEQGNVIISDNIIPENDKTILEIPKTIKTDTTNNIKIFAISENVLRPDFYSSSFIVSDEESSTHTTKNIIIEQTEQSQDWTWGIVLAVIAVIGIGAYILKRSRL